MRDLLEKIFNGKKSGFDTLASENVWPAPPAAEGEKKLRSAAVLVPLINYDRGMKVLLTQRTETMPDHAGQIAFPGGGQRKGEISPEQTALRETQEEIGLVASQIKILGRMNARDTGTGYRVMPIIGIIAPPLSLTPDPSEVAKVFEVPLDFIIDPVNHRLETRSESGRSREYYVLPYNEYYIWGLTARILVELGKILRKA